MGALKPLVIAAASLAAAIAPPTSAQCRLCEQPSTGRSDETGTGGDVELQIESNLNFDRLILSGTGVGSAIIRPDGSSGAEGSVLEVGPRAMVGTVLVHGDANRAVRVELPRRIDLFSVGGGRITLDDVTTNLAPDPRLDSAGNLSFRFGGRLTISGDTDVPYRGDLAIPVQYQ